MTKDQEIMDWKFESSRMRQVLQEAHHNNKVEAIETAVGIRIDDLLQSMKSTDKIILEHIAVFKRVHLAINPMGARPDRPPKDWPTIGD